MFSSTILSLPFLVTLSSAIVQSPVQGPLKGFNYNPQDDAATLFPLVQSSLPKIGASGFTSARLYTALDPNNTTNPVPHPAFKVAGDTNTSVLIGLAVSLGDASFQNELTALTAILKDKSGTYGKLLSRNLIVGISVGNEDFYRQSLQGTPMAANQGAGSKSAVIIKQINAVRKLLSQQSPSLATKIPVGHSDTWRMWTNKDYGLQLLKAQPDQDDFAPIDFVGMQEFTYWEGYAIQNFTAYSTEALAAVKAAAGNIPVWATETGWPVKGPKCCNGPPADSGMPGQLAWPGKEEAQIYWKGVGCDTLFGGEGGGTGAEVRNTWWYRIFASTAKSGDGAQDWDVLGSAKSGDGGATAAFDLDCKAVAPSAPTPTAVKSSSKSAGSVLRVEVWWSVVPLLVVGVLGAVERLFV
ncbi:uncharacterized protein KY384_005613 [Bacidia gigantensis]|uniref:uncharacterized protein n=1 Tax=Bacidia gigantensis TaxID=2732470 RepID=UPI001D04010D|nr:uncharacterized protein KY384_005613 [Bacidia gigantensis]KAG8530130.1 hypothetical protein KY384_005613 [Bacidia gigantensis]